MFYGAGPVEGVGLTPPPNNKLSSVFDKHDTVDTNKNTDDKILESVKNSTEYNNFIKNKTEENLCNSDRSENDSDERCSECCRD